MAGAGNEVGRKRAQLGGWSGLTVPVWRGESRVSPRGTESPVWWRLQSQEGGPRLRGGRVEAGRQELPVDRMWGGRGESGAPLRCLVELWVSLTGQEGPPGGVRAWSGSSSVLVNAERCRVLGGRACALDNRSLQRRDLAPGSMHQDWHPKPQGGGGHGGTQPQLGTAR